MNYLRECPAEIVVIADLPVVQKGHGGVAHGLWIVLIDALHGIIGIDQGVRTP